MSTWFLFFYDLVAPGSGPKGTPKDRVWKTNCTECGKEFNHWLAHLATNAITSTSVSKFFEAVKVIEELIPTLKNSFQDVLVDTNVESCYTCKVNKGDLKTHYLEPFKSWYLSNDRYGYFDSKYMALRYDSPQYFATEELAIATAIKHGYKVMDSSNENKREVS